MTIAIASSIFDDGKRRVLERRVRARGTPLLHSHRDEMILMGMRWIWSWCVRGDQASRRCDFAPVVHEWRVDIGARDPNPNETTDFNVLTINGRAFSKPRHVASGV